MLVIAAFTFPPIYTRFRAEIDHARGHLGGICTNHYNNYHDQFTSATQPHFSKVSTALGTVFGTGAAPAAAAAAPSIRSMKAPSVKSVHPAASIKSAKPASVKSVKPASVRSMKSGGGMNPAMVAGGAALGGAALGAGAMAMMGGSSGASSVAGSAAHSVKGSVPPSVRSGGASAAGSVYDSEYSGYEDESYMDEGSYAGTIASAVH